MAYSAKRCDVADPIQRPVVRRWASLAEMASTPLPGLRDEHNTLHDYTLHLERQLAEARYAEKRLRHERDIALRNLRNLLAVMHCDGGHYTEAAGLSRSVQDAHEAWGQVRVALEEALREKAEAENQRDYWKNEWGKRGEAAYIQVAQERDALALHNATLREALVGATDTLAQVRLAFPLNDSRREDIRGYADKYRQALATTPDDGLLGKVRELCAVAEKAREVLWTFACPPAGALKEALTALYAALPSLKGAR